MTCFTCNKAVDSSDSQAYVASLDGKDYNFHLCWGCIAISQYYFIGVCEVCGTRFWVNYDRRLVYPRLMFTKCANMGRKILCLREAKPCVH